MVQRKKFIGMKTRFYTYQSHLHCIGYLKEKSLKSQEIATPVCALVRNDSLIVSEIGNLGRLQLKLKLVSNKRNKFRIGGFSYALPFGEGGPLAVGEVLTSSDLAGARPPSPKGKAV